MEIVAIQQLMADHGVEQCANGSANPVTGEVKVAYRPFPNNLYEAEINRNVASMFKPVFEELTEGWKP
jgi:hypothetical protein